MSVGQGSAVPDGYVLYYSPGAASMAVHWMLIEGRIPFEAVRVDVEAGAQRDPAYLRLNPDGRVPTLIVDGRARRESAALLMLLAERHPASGFAPPLGAPARAEWFETMIYLANGLLPAMRDWFYAAQDGDPGAADEVTAHARRRIEDAWSSLDARLGEGAHLVGDAFGTADMLAMMLMRWSREMPRPATDWPRIARYVRSLRTRPSYLELHEREGLSAWPTDAWVAGHR